MVGVVIESEDPELNYMFARYVKGADVQAHLNLVNLSESLESKLNRLNNLLQEEENNIKIKKLTK